MLVILKEDQNAHSKLTSHRRPFSLWQRVALTSLRAGLSSSSEKISPNPRSIEVDVACREENEAGWRRPLPTAPWRARAGHGAEGMGLWTEVQCVCRTNYMCAERRYSRWTVLEVHMEISVHWLCFPQSVIQLYLSCAVLTKYIVITCWKLVEYLLFLDSS